MFCCPNCQIEIDDAELARYFAAKGGSTITKRSRAASIANAAKATEARMKKFRERQDKKEKS